MTYKLNNNLREICRVLPHNILSQFHFRQLNKINKLKHDLQFKTYKKIETLINERNFHIKNKIRPINYCKNDNSRIFMNPMSFDSHSELHEIKEEWFVNISDVPIPKNVQTLVQLGDRFNLPSSNIDKASFSIIKNVESSLRNIRANTIPIIRNKTVDIVKKLRNNNKPSNEKTRLLENLFLETKNFIQNNKNIMFTRADKGNITVAMNTIDYNEKMNKILIDKQTYTKIDKDPIKGITNDLKILLKRWKINGYIEDLTYKRLLTTDGLLPRAYGLPKVHKKDNPLRIIISSIDSPLYSLANFLHKILIKSIEIPLSHIKNSYELVEKLRNIELGEDYTIFSLDVISLFTNIPIDLAIESIQSRWNLIKSSTKIPKKEFICGIKLVLNSTYFTFEKRIFKQIFGTPMGSPLSPVIADLVMRDLETKALNSLQFEAKLYVRYVDDILIATPKNQIENTRKAFNSLHDRLQFTNELSENNKINFLNVSILHKNNRLQFDLYFKPTFSRRYLNFDSHHPVSQKRSVIFGLVDKVLKLSDFEFQQNNFKRIIEILLKNGYPLPFVFSNINKRINNIKNINTKNIDNNDNNIKYFIKIPFIEKITPEIFKISKEHKFNTIFTINNKLSNIIKTRKDKIDKMNCPNVVYKITCKDCDASYVGQTKRQLHTRLKEHKMDINKKSGINSVISLHQLNNSHSFDWENVEILDKEHSYYNRITSEMIHIKKQINGINKQNDTEQFPDIYLPFINPPSP